MAIFQFDDYKPEIGSNCYIADSAEVIGNVILKEGCYVGPGAILRGDYGQIIIGENCGIEENVVIHARPGEVCTLGNWVTIGHGAVIHNVKIIHDYAVIGMKAVVSDWSEVGQYAAVAEGAVIRNGQIVKDGEIAAGVPAKIIGNTSEKWREQWKVFKKYYVDFAHTYRNRLTKLG